jgi:prevent-host-death family protein
MPTVNVHEAKTHLSRYLKQVVQGDELIIARAGHPLARLVPHDTALPPRVLGLGQGEATIPADFDRMAAEEIAGLFEGQGA